jgi:hypothetical protein
MGMLLDEKEASFSQFFGGTRMTGKEALEITFRQSLNLEMGGCGDHGAEF